MVSLGLRAEFGEGSPWGSLSKLRRYEVATPNVPGPIHGISETVGCAHGERSSLIVRIGGGHLLAEPGDLLHRLTQEAILHIDARYTDPAEQVRHLVTWLECEQRAGFLIRAYITATLVIAVSDVEVWAWLVSPHGLVHGPTLAMSFGSTDLRYPVLRKLGIFEEPAFKFAGTEAGDKASSIFCIGTPAGYEAIRLRVPIGDVVVSLDRGSLPFGPWPEHPIELGAIWNSDAAWRHGLAGIAVAFGCVGSDALQLPAEWNVREVPLRTK